MIRILIVDDEEIIRKVMVKTFGKYGICKAVTNGNDALKIFKKAFESGAPYQLLILDLSLEDISGLDILKEIRQIEKENKIAKDNQAITIMVTGNNEREVVKECIIAGCNDYILKPLKPDTVKEKLKSFGISPLSEAELMELEKAAALE